MRPKNPSNLRPKGQDAPTQKASHAGAKDTISEALLDEASALGNSEMQALLNRGAQTREALLQFLLSRLTQMHQSQIREAALLKQRDAWFISVHMGRDHLPKPNRWHSCALAYKKAALALCRGDLNRGWQLLNKGLKEEASAKQDAPKRLQLDPSETPSAPAAPKTDMTRPVDGHAALELANQILNNDHQVDPASTRKKKLHDWFSVAEEDEEEPPNAS